MTSDGGLQYWEGLLIIIVLISHDILFIYIYIYVYIYIYACIIVSKTHVINVKMRNSDEECKAVFRHRRDLHRASLIIDFEF